MKKILTILCLLTLTVAVSSCSKDDEEIKTPLEITELVGKWVKIGGDISSETVVNDTINVDTIKVIEFTADNRLKITRGKFCSLKTDLGSNEEGWIEYYSSNKSVNGTSNRIKFEKCTQGMPISLQGDILQLGYGNQVNASERYKRIIEIIPEEPENPENPELPENPEEPTDPDNPETGE